MAGSPTVTIHIAARGTEIKGSDKPSAVGHMWYELDDGEGNKSSYGFAPDEKHHGQPFAPGKVYDDDTENYLNPQYSRTVEISKEQYDAMKDFGDHPDAPSDPTKPDSPPKFSLKYNGLNNSCIDFTWKAMRFGGMNDGDYQGKIWPTHNIDKVEKALNAFEALSKSKGGGGGGSNFHCHMGTVLKCSFGAAPSTLVVLPKNMEITENTPGANIMDHIPMVNIMPFGMCSSLANPTVAAATAAAMGALTPMPCIPATAAPWVPGVPTVLLANMPVLDNNSKCMCNWAGVITVAQPGVTMTHVP